MDGGRALIHCCNCTIIQRQKQLSVNIICRCDKSLNHRHRSTFEIVVFRNHGLLKSRSGLSWARWVYLRRCNFSTLRRDLCSSYSSSADDVLSTLSSPLKASLHRDLDSKISSVDPVTLVRRECKQRKCKR
ncbi:hypothetical protein TNIN_230511 [Trichonephila inaurata madagascariensis]|uniref:Uncharacterized protein n=1 Tax=Trichonephila inaurata madagascariensis TaxID=2747483 RepID=A0A8X6JWB3_9ARAC|nr:hypothetical protein TNIN_479461 [Trichonephila inaurata madagascariensis]GFY73405.1 hypothetical protein TNIN_230511 [Trichonephila inaurata madagascariensis]